MTEIFQILQLYIVFTLFLIAPLSLFKKKLFNFELNKSSILFYNLVLNLNLLLMLSLLPLQLNSYYMYFIIILILFVFRNYLFEIKNLELKNNTLPIFIFFTILFAISIDIANKLDLGWDAKWFWLIKSLYFYENKTFEDLSSFALNDFHPHLGSYIWAFFRKISFINYEYHGRIFYAFFYVCSIFFICKDLFKNKNLNLIIFLILVIITYNYKYFSGLQEILLFSVILIISKTLFEYMQTKKFSDLIFIILCSNLILWIKAEGIAYFFIVLIAVNLIKNLKMSERLKFNLVSLFFLIFKYSIYNFYVIETNNQPYYLDYIINLNFDIIFYKIYNIFLFFAYNNLTNFIILLTLIILIINFKKLLIDNYYRNILIIYLLNICFIFSCYIFRDMEIIYSLRTTIDRIMFTSSGFYLFFILFYFRKLSSSLIK